MAILWTSRSKAFHYQRLCFTLLFHSNPPQGHKAQGPVSGMFDLNLRWLEAKSESEVFFNICKYSCPCRMKSETIANGQRQIILRNKNQIPKHQLKCFISDIDCLFMGFIYNLWLSKAFVTLAEAKQGFGLWSWPASWSCLIKLYPTVMEGLRIWFRIIESHNGSGWKGP